MLAARWLSTTTARRRLLTPPTARAAAGAAAASTPPPPIDVLYADKHLVVVNKPPGLLSQGATDAASPDMLTLLRTHLTVAAGKPPTKPVYLGLVHRLDRNVSCGLHLRLDDGGDWDGRHGAPGPFSNLNSADVRLFPPTKPITSLSIHR